MTRDGRSVIAPDPWWNRPAMLAGAVMLAAVPLLWPRIVPLLDLPSHMAGYYVSINLERSVTLRQYFGFHWHVIGNLGVDALEVPLGRLIGVEAATKLLVMLITTATAAGALLISRAAFGKVQPAAFAAIPITFNYALMLGFVNYDLAVAMALISFGVWLRWPAERRPVARAAVFATVAILVWLAHAIGWVMLGAMAGPAEAYRRYADRQPWRKIAAGTLVTCLPLLVPALLMPLSPHTQATSAQGFFMLLLTAKWIVMLLRDRWIVLDLLSAGCVLALIGASIVRLGRLRVSPLLAWPALALFALFVLAPQEINGSDYVAARIAPYAVILAVLMIDCSSLSLSRQRWLAGACVAFLLVRIAANTASFYLYDRSYSRELQALSHVPRGGTVVALVGLRCWNNTANWADPRLYHLPGLAVVRNEAFVNTTWSIGGLHLLENRYRQAGSFASDPSEMVSVETCKEARAPMLSASLASLPYRAFDRLWLINVPPPLWPHDPRLRPLWRSEHSVIYAIDHAT